MLRSGFALAILVAITIISLSQAEISKDDLVNIYATYDVPEEEIEDCQEGDLGLAMCPEDDTVPCTSMEVLRKFCEDQIGPENTAKMAGIEKEQGKNALEGCMKYVGFFVFDQDHIACCDSDHCEDWIEQKFEEIYGGDYYDVDDDEVMDDDEEF